MGVQVIGMVHTGSGKEGDFVWMIEQAEYDDALFIFNDNEEAFTAFVAGTAPGGGNAVIRPYRAKPRPRAAGIPTGKNNAGYQSVDECKDVVADAMGVIEEILASAHPPYQRVIYSSDTPNGELGFSIYKPSADVITYLTAQIKKLVSSTSGP